MAGEKRGSAESGYEQQRSPWKRVKMRDLESVCRSDGISFQVSDFLSLVLLHGSNG